MKRRIFNLMVLLVIITVMALTVGCVRGIGVGKLQVESESVELGGAESVRVEVRMGLGKLKVEGGADELMNAEFTYNVAEWKPEVKYRVSGGQGYLTVQQPSEVEDIPVGEVRYEWDLRFNNDVPLNLSIVLGAGSSHLELGGLSLSKLDVVTGAGEGTIDLTGDWTQSLDVIVKGGVGKANLRLPSDVGVRVKLHGGIGNIDIGDFYKDDGAYVNEAYGESEVTLNIDITGGVGQVNLELGD